MPLLSHYHLELPVSTTDKISGVDTLVMYDLGRQVNIDIKYTKG